MIRVRCQKDEASFRIKEFKMKIKRVRNMTKREEVLNTLIEVFELDKALVSEDSRYSEDLGVTKSFLFFQLHAVLEDRYNTNFDIYRLSADTIGETIDYIITIIGE